MESRGGMRSEMSPHTVNSKSILRMEGVRQKWGVGFHCGEGAVRAGVPREERQHFGAVGVWGSLGRGHRKLWKHSCPAGTWTAGCPAPFAPGRTASVRLGCGGLPSAQAQPE